MDIRRSSLCSIFLAILAATEATASTDVVEPTSGEVRLVFSSDKASSLPIDAAILEMILCRYQPGAPGGQCRLKMGTTGPGSEFGLEVLTEPTEPTNEPKDSYRVHWQPFSLGGFNNEPIETSCGVWDFLLGLEEVESQPISEANLVPSHIAGSGLYTSILKVRVWVHLVSRVNPPETRDFSLLLGVALTGIWNAPTSSEPGMSNLSLMEGDDDKCFPVWVLESPADWEDPLEGECQFCFKGNRSSSTSPDEFGGPL